MMCCTGIRTERLIKKHKLILFVVGYCLRGNLAFQRELVNSNNSFKFQLYMGKISECNYLVCEDANIEQQIFVSISRIFT